MNTLEKKAIKSFYKENLIENLSEFNSNKIIYISSSNNNLEYYYKKMKESQKKVKYLDLNSYSKYDLIGINIEIIDFFNSDDTLVLFIDLNLALRVFFDEYIKKDFKVDEEYKRKDLENFLIENDYTKVYNVENKGEYAIRGDIIDVFPSNLEKPIRLDFFDELLEDIKEFEVFSQKSINKFENVTIYGNNLFGEEKNICEISEIFKNNSLKIIIENKELLDFKLEHIISIDRDNENLFIKRYEKILENSERIEVLKNDNVNYDDEIREKKSNLLKKGVSYKDITKIREGDYVIHIEFGIGIFRKIVNINNRDYLYIQYADHDKLYIPIEKLNRISKYISTLKAPELYSLGTKGYKRKQKKLKENIEEYAKELIEIQAKRMQSNKIPYMKDTIWQEEFEEKFPYNLTLDQKQALNDMKNDLESGILMDRLLIGDVGFGKTEVALRIAFKAVENGDQCVILAPTTVLANQHYERCKKRFESFGIVVKNFSRLTEKETKNTIEGLKNGTVDIVIATHKILSDNVKFKNLGLLIIDEEQKFGVKAKEKLKKIKSDIHLLSLSATPIPRTLNLALLGIRDISIINTMPIDRNPIITKRIKEDKLKKVILDEILRDGQVFYITNNVKAMEEKKKYLKTILPEFIGIEYINGQLNPKRIKQIIDDFEKGKFEILIASTIIENGIDISNANTIIIEKYTHLGLSQIYQLRGRVGRGKRQGYCYLLDSEYKTKKGKSKDESLDKIEGVSSAGYILSLEDLDIRGAGEILGEKQHGIIDVFGYDLYLKMLKEEMEKIRGNISNSFTKDIDIKIKESGYIPEEYIEKDERIVIYKRYSELTTLEELKELNFEVRDRFGKIPKIMLEFIYFMYIKIWSLENKVDKIFEEKNRYTYFIDDKEYVLLKKIVMEEIKKYIPGDVKNEKNNIIY